MRENQKEKNNKKVHKLMCQEKKIKLIQIISRNSSWFFENAKKQKIKQV